MGASQTSNTTQQQTQTADPRTQAAISPILGQVSSVWQTPYNSGMDPRVASQNSQQLVAISGLGGLQANNPSSPFISQANQYSQLAASPENVTRMAAEFYNPMSQQVLNQLGNVFGQQNAQLLGNAAASGAIGGSRYSVAAGNLANQQGLAAGQTLAGLQQQALNAAQTEQGQISQQAFTQGQLGQEALNTQQQGIMAALQGGNLTQQQAQALLNAQQQGSIQRTLFPQQELATAANIAGVGSLLGGQSYGTGQTQTPVNYANMIGGIASLGAGLVAADGGAITKKRQHRAIGGGTGIGLGDSGVEGFAGIPSQGSSGLNYNGVQSGLAPYFAQSPQVHVPQVNFPQLNLNPQQQNSAQNQPFSDPKQMQALGQNLGTMGNAADTYLNADFGGGDADFAHGGRVHRQSGGSVASGFPQSIADAIQKHPDATSIKQNPDGGHNVQLQNGIGIKYPGQKQAPNGGTVKHRDDGGPVAAPWNFQSDSPSQDLIRAREQPMVFPTSAPVIPGPDQYKTSSPWANAPAIPLAGDQAPQDVTAPSGLMADYLEHRRDPSYRPGWPTQIASINPIQGLPGDPGIPKLPDRLEQPAQQAAIASPVQTQPSVAQPKPAPQPGANQQPQFGTPEWRNWADSYGRVSIQGETGRSSAFQGLGEINTHDTNGTHSYGNYGLNSGGSAQEFVRQYGLDGIGLTAQPGTAMFDMQWREAAKNPASADILRRAEIDYYNKHYVTPTVSGMSQYLPVNIANNRAAQEYMIDKSVQQGTGTWDGTSGIGLKHIRRAQQAAEESGGDPVKFVQRMAQLDHAAVGSDFPAALHSGAYSPLGDLNRLHTRVAGALGELGEGIQALPGQIGSGIRSMFGGDNQQGASRSVLDRPDLQPPKPGESELDKRMEEFGFRRNEPQGLGGSLGRALGMNPSLSQQNSNRLVNLGLGMLAAGPSVGVKGFPGAAISLGKGIGAGGQYALQQEQQERNQAIALANAAMNQKLHEAQIANYEREATQPRQIAHEMVYDDFNQPHVLPIMGVPDKNAPGGWRQVPTTGHAGSAQPSGATQGGNMFDRINAIPSDLEGDAFIAEAKKQGINESLLDPANRVAHYKADPNKLFSYRDNRRQIVDALAARINKNYDQTKYAGVAATQKAIDAGDVAKSNRAIGKLFDEADTTIDKAQNLHNWRLENANALAGRLSPSGSKNTAARTAFGYAVDNLAEAGAAAAKGVGASNEGDVKRRYKLMNPDMHIDAIKAGILTEVETTLKMGQSNLTAYNSAHGYTPDNPHYLTIMDKLTPAQQKRAIKLLGPEKIEEITGKPVPGALPVKPAHLPSGTQYNAQRKQFRDPAGNLYDLNGNPI